MASLWASMVDYQTRQECDAHDREVLWTYRRLLEKTVDVTKARVPIGDN